MNDLGQFKPTFVYWLHQKANLGHIICPTDPLKVPMGSLDWVNHYFWVFGNSLMYTPQRSSDKKCSNTRMHLFSLLIIFCFRVF